MSLTGIVGLEGVLLLEERLRQMSSIANARAGAAFLREGVR